MAIVQKSQAGAQKPETRSPPAAAKPAPQGALPNEKIAQRAYEIWQAKGRPMGQDQDHWFQAERELRAALTGSRSSR
jgi:hypothetical protein